MKKILYFAFFIGVLMACVEPYEHEFSTSNRIILVDGLVANDANLKPIILRESKPDEDGSLDIQQISKAKVSIIVNGQTTVNLTEKEEGVYYFDPAFRGEIGSTYQLKFTMEDGNTFESTVDKITPSVPIEKTYHKLEPEAFRNPQGKVSAGYLFYVDYNDPAADENQYLWGWQLFERQYVCRTCIGGLYNRTPQPNGACVSDPQLARFNNVYDYGCETNCWEMIYSTDLLVQNDEFTNSQAVKGQLIGKVPLYSNGGALLDIFQYSISKKAYSFIKLTQQQSVKTGSLADTPPAALVGNIKCTSDRTVNTSGYFIVAGKTKKQYWLDKKDLTTKYPLIGLLGGRATRFEPAGNSTTRPPNAPCLESAFRTKNRPIGWLDN